MATRSRESSSASITLLSPRYEEFNKLIPETLSSVSSRSRPSSSARLQLGVTQQLHHSLSSFHESASTSGSITTHHLSSQRRNSSASSLRNVSTQNKQKNRGYQYPNKRRGRPGYDACSDEGSIASAPITSMQHFVVSRGRTKTRSEQARDESPVSRHSSSLETVRKLSPEIAGGAMISRKTIMLQDVRKVIDDLNKSSGGDRRLDALSCACAEFDHTDEAKHDIELQYGAAFVLTKLLGVASDDDEIQLICVAIEMVFRASPKYMLLAFEKVGSSLIPLLLRLLERYESGILKYGDVGILNISRILHHVSRVSELRMSLTRQEGMLDALQRVATAVLNPDCRAARVRVIANLAKCDENRVLLFEHKGLLDSLLRIVHMESSDEAREYAGAALMELAACPTNHVEMAHNDKLLGTLVKVALLEKVSDARESSVTALQNLAFCKDNRVRLSTFKNGIVLEALKKVLSSDSNFKARRRAAGALTNMACDETAERMGCQAGLLETLAIVASKDKQEEVQTRSCMALTKLAASITVHMNCYDTLLDALVVASLSSATNSVSAVLRVKARDPDNRSSMARHPGILDTLADICANGELDVKDRDNAMRAIMHLTNENSNRKVMCNKTILDALVIGASMDDGELEIRESAIRAIERLATEFSNRAYMARHDGLLVAVAKATEREAKLQDAGAASDHAFLAKPLLMSLLVAM